MELNCITTDMHGQSFASSTISLDMSGTNYTMLPECSGSVPVIFMLRETEILPCAVKRFIPPWQYFLAQSLAGFRQAMA